MQDIEDKVTNYRVPQGTTHLMMWLGGGLPINREVKYNSNAVKDLVYENKKDRKVRSTTVNYVDTLEGECKKMAAKGESCILVYDSKMIKPEEEEKMRDIVNNIANCYLVDYEEFVGKLKQDEDKEFHYHGETIRQSDFIDAIQDVITCNAEMPHFSSSNIVLKGSIGDLVDCMRMLLLLHPSKLKQLAIEKNRKDKEYKLDPTDYSLLYNDFDMIQDPNYVEAGDQKSFNDIQGNCLKFGYPQNALISYNLENGIIYAKSINDHNPAIEWSMTSYFYNSNSIYGILSFNNDMANNFQGFRDENHCSWRNFDDKSLKQVYIHLDNGLTNLTERKLLAIIYWFYNNKNSEIELIDKGNTWKIGLKDFIKLVEDKQQRKAETDYKTYLDIAKKITNNKATKEDGQSILNAYNEIHRGEKVKKLQTKISKAVNNLLGKSENNQKKLYWWQRNHKLLNERKMPWKDCREDIKQINSYYSNQLKEYNNLNNSDKSSILKKLYNYVNELNNKNKQASYTEIKKPSFACYSNKEWNDYLRKTANNYHTANKRSCTNGHSQGMY